MIARRITSQAYQHVLMILIIKRLPGTSEQYLAQTVTKGMMYAHKAIALSATLAANRNVVHNARQMRIANRGMIVMLPHAVAYQMSSAVME